MSTRVPLSDDVVAALPIDGGRAELLEEILAVDPATRPEVAARPWSAPLAAAAAVLAVVVATTLWPAGPQPVTGPAATWSPGDRAVLDAPGWVAVRADGFGGVTYESGGRSLEVTVAPEEDFAAHQEDRRRISDPPTPGEEVEVLGVPSRLWSYDDQSHVVLRGPEGGAFLEVVADGVEEDELRALLASISLVDVATFEASLPPSFLTGAERAAAVRHALRGIEDAVGADLPLLPPGGDPVTSDALTTYVLGVDVAGSVACQWLEEYVEAQGRGPRADRAARVLATVRDWPVLTAIKRDGGYTEVVYQYAAEVRRGEVPADHVQGLGCPRR